MPKRSISTLPSPSPSLGVEKLTAVSSTAVETPREIAGGVVHELPADMHGALASDAEALATWDDITPLARNEWICWITSAKKEATRSHRIEWGLSNLREGKRRPCCWPGCPHR